MQRIGCYDDTAELIEYLCEQLDITEPELVDRLFDMAVNGVGDPDIADWYQEFYERK